MIRLMQTTDNGNKEWAAWVKAGDPVWYTIMDFGDDKDIPKSAGFQFHGVRKEDGTWGGKKLWWTSDIDKAAQLADYAAGSCAETLSQRKIQLVTSLEASSAATTDTEFLHPEGLNYYPFQKAGIEYMLPRPNTLLGDDMGLGKTVQSIGLYNNSDIWNVLVICPAGLKLNWKREWTKWDIKGSKVAIASPKTVPLPEHGYNVIVTNYETVSKINSKLADIMWDLVVIDEAHYLKNQKTIRYRSIFGYDADTKKSKMVNGELVQVADKKFKQIQYKRLVMATGTPICNRPMELWPLISKIDPEKWNAKSFHYYQTRFCNGSSKGASSPARLNELQVLLRQRCMVRRLKADVLTELPPKVRQIIELDYDENDEGVIQALNGEKAYRNIKDVEMLEAAIKVELAKASNSDEEYKEAIKSMRDIASVAFEEMSTIRKNTAVAKIPYAIEYVENLLETIPKIIVFCHHQEVMDAISKHWKGECVSIRGGMKDTDKQLAVDRFQQDAKYKIAVVSILAGGVGITLTAASYEVFVEPDWVPGNLTQAEDRAHRIGQTDVVFVYHLVLRDSMDVKIMQRVIEKQEIIEQALDKFTEVEPIMIGDEEAATKNTTRKQVIKEAETIDVKLIPHIHIALQILAGSDMDYARSANGVGFNAIDSRIGHSLAESRYLTTKQAVLGKKIVEKYRKQLPINIYSSIFGNDDEVEEW